jgi:hypothetical protein
MRRMISGSSARTFGRNTAPPLRSARTGSPVRSVGNQAALRRLIPSAYRLSVSGGDEKAPAPEASPAVEPALGDTPSAEELQGKSGAKAAAPACGEKAKVVPKTNTTTINGEDLIDFVDNINRMMGAPHAQTLPSYQPFVSANNRVEKVNMTLNVELVVPRYGSGRKVLSQKEKDLIAKAVKLITDHEQQHQAIAEQVMNQAVCAAIGQTEAQADKIIEDFRCNKLGTAQEDFDAKSGLLVIDLDAQGNAVDVHAGPLAKRPNYHCPSP